MDPTLTNALALNQAMTRQQISLDLVKMAAQNDQQLVAMLSQSVQSAPSSSNPAHLGQSLDTFA